MRLISKLCGVSVLLKNRQLRLEREKRRALEESNSILSAYLALLIEKEGGVRVPRELIRSVIGRYRARVKVSGDDYIISVDKFSDCQLKRGSAHGEAESVSSPKGDVSQ